MLLSQASKLELVFASVGSTRTDMQLEYKGDVDNIKHMLLMQIIERHFSVLCKAPRPVDPPAASAKITQELHVL